VGVEGQSFITMRSTPKQVAITGVKPPPASTDAGDERLSAGRAYCVPGTYVDSGAGFGVGTLGTLPPSFSQVETWSFTVFLRDCTLDWPTHFAAQ
jgi:hypothetical protein